MQALGNSIATIDIQIEIWKFQDKLKTKKNVSISAS